MLKTENRISYALHNLTDSIIDKKFKNHKYITFLEDFIIEMRIKGYIKGTLSRRAYEKRQTYDYEHTTNICTIF